MIEKEKQKRAFEQYYAMGPSRSLSRLARKLGVASNTAKNWSTWFGWQERIDERDRAVAQVVKSEAIKAEVASQIRNKQIVQLALVTLAHQIAEGKIRGTLADLDRLVRLEAFLEGRAESRQEIISRDLQGKSTAELKVMLRQEIEALEEISDAEVEAVELGQD